MDIRYGNADCQFTLRAAALIIQDDHLLAVKNTRMNCSYTIGGGVHHGETTEEAVLRECLEETGCHFAVERLVFVQERFFQVDDRKHHEIVFLYLLKPPGPFAIARTTDQTGEQLCWLPFDSLETNGLVPAFLRGCIQQLPLTVQHIISEE